VGRGGGIGYETAAATAQSRVLSAHRTVLSPVRLLRPLAYADRGDAVRRLRTIYAWAMPGSRPAGFLFGASAERLAEFILGSFAFTTPVPYQVDIGHDFHCVLHRPAANRRMLRSGPAFSVQVKSTQGPVTYEAGDAATWLSDQESPLFLCIVNRPVLTCSIYSTWNMHNAHLLHGPLRTVLEPNATIGEFGLPTRIEDTLHVPLGPPVLRLTPADVVDSSLAIGWAELLEPWILIDREIIVNRRAGMFWVMGPRRWTTNEPLPDPDSGLQWMVGFYRNPKNLPRCVDNLLRSAVAVRRIIDSYQAEGHLLDHQPQTDALDRLLEVFDDDLDPLARHVLREREAE